jgi:GDP-4-dehydro-6-deoxy-D-mannose reductase
VAATRHEELPNDHPILTADLRAAVRWIECDLRQTSQIAAALDETAPDAVFHLAGVSFVPAAKADPAAALQVNVLGAARLLEHVRARKELGSIDPVVLVVGSAIQYGSHPPQSMPLGEDCSQEPRNVYGASKAAQEVLALSAWRGDGIRVIATRSFNHSGPGQPTSFVLPRLVRDAIALGVAGEGELVIGNDTTRDFLHVSDVARAYVDLVEKGQVGEVYNVASGTGVTVENAARRVLALAGVDAKLKMADSLRRNSDVPILVGNPAKLIAATGWSPRYSLDTIIEDLLRAAPR